MVFLVCSVYYLFVIYVFRFPKDPALRQKWTNALRRKDWKPTKYTKLCSDHFTESQIDRSGARVRLQRLLKTTARKLPQKKSIPNAIAVAVLQNIDLKKIFPELDQHMIECAVEDNHTLHLIKIISKKYCDIRLYDLGIEHNLAMRGLNVRKKLSKQILFQHQ